MFLFITNCVLLWVRLWLFISMGYFVSECALQFPFSHLTYTYISSASLIYSQSISVLERWNNSSCRVSKFSPPIDIIRTSLSYLTLFVNIYHFRSMSTNSCPRHEFTSEQSSFTLCSVKRLPPVFGFESQSQPVFHPTSGSFDGCLCRKNKPNVS